MSLRTLTSVVAVAVILATAPAALAEGVAIVFPPDHAAVTSRKVRVIGTAPAAETSVTVAVGGGDLQGAARVPTSRGAFSFVVALRDGINTIKVATSSATSTVTLFHDDSGKVAEGFGKLYLHADAESWADCESCHLLPRRGGMSYRRINPVSGCLNGNCHKGFLNNKFIHGPAAGKTCTGCHNPHGSFLPRFVSRSGKSLCFTCHTAEEKRFQGKVMHSPVEMGECTWCHDPHQSDVKFQLRGGSIAGLCARCHGDDRMKHKFLHGPVGTGNCIACHSPHAAEHPKLLYQERNSLCFMCHKDREEEFKRKHLHKPVTQDCGLCHDPHGSEFRFQLRNDLKGDAQGQTAPCLSCHRKINPALAETILRAEVPHKPVKDGNCTACHTPHSTNFEHQLKAPVKELCFSCHTELGDAVAAAKSKHGPVESSDCASCHNVHGSPHTRLLLNEFPPEFYTPYATKKYSLCFNCHNEKVALEKWSKETEFRNGTRNLHFVHVNKEKGRSCKACHEVHAGNQEKHIREEVPYGKGWNYPITYTKTSTGGGCTVGCHRPLTYDREHEVKY